MAKLFFLIFLSNLFGSFHAVQIVPQDALLFLADLAFELLDGHSKDAVQLKAAMFSGPNEAQQKGCSNVQLNPGYVQKFGTAMQNALYRELSDVQRGDNGTNGKMPCQFDDQMAYAFIYSFGNKLLNELLAKSGQKLGPIVEEYSALKKALNSRADRQQIKNNSAGNGISVEAYSPVANSPEESENWVELMKIIASKGEDLKWAEFSKAKNDTFGTFKGIRVQSSIFEGNKQNIRAHNEAYARKELTYKLGLNHFADYCIQYLFNTNCKSRARYIRDYDSWPLLEAVNGTKYVNDILDKTKIMDTLYGEGMHCSKTSFAFAAASTLETHIAKRTGKLHRLSAKQFMDCAGQFGVNEYGKCTGGGPDQCYQYMTDDKNYGVEEWNSYKIQTDSACLYNASNSVANIVDWDTITMNSADNYALYGEDGLKLIIAKMGPVSASLVYHEKLFLYHGGVYYDRYCNSAAGAIFVTVVGYGTDEQSGMDFWLIKNHWGKDWGENGYIRLARNRGNSCLIVAYASFPLFESWQKAYAEIGIQV